MDRQAQSIYVSEISVQCELAILAGKNLNYFVENKADDRDNEIFRNIHSFLTHAGNVSRIFWPDVPKRKKDESEEDYDVRIGEKDERAVAKRQRGDCIKEIFNMPETSCLRVRALRNHLEHFDERLDDWRRTTKKNNMCMNVIGPPDIMALGGDPKDIMRWFNIENGQYVFRGESFDLNTIYDEIKRVYELSVEISSRLARRS